MSCGCSDSTTPCVSLCPDSSGCPIQLDFECVIYHKDNTDVNALSNIGLTNGATLELFAETAASLLAGVKVDGYNLPYLRAHHTVNSMKQLEEAVDIELLNVTNAISDLQTNVNILIAPVDSNSINLTVSGLNDHTIKADAVISPQANNQLSILADGLFAAPQTLSVNPATKQISISNGNTVSVAGLVTGIGGFLGLYSADPTAVLDGQYWYNTTSNQLKIKVNSLVKVITIS